MKRPGLTYETVREMAQRLPETVDGTSYGTAALKVRGKMFVRLKEDGTTIVLRTDSFEREHLLRTAPNTFFVTDHYRDYPWVLARLASADVAQLQQLIEDAWRRVAPKGLIKLLDATKKS
ncbi:MAG: MmcQ/YjbR family DNA-binding protein [Gemmatimonadaceae bacterium]